MTGAALGALATAGLLGLTHAVEPDHVAGVAVVAVAASLLFDAAGVAL